jgi:aspartate beta-hydroxylase
MTPTLEQLEAEVAADPSDPVSWLRLGALREKDGRDTAALLARFEAVTRAQLQGQWVDARSTPPALLDDVIHAIDQVRKRRRDIYLGCYDGLRQLHGGDAVARVDKAVLSHLKVQPIAPPDPRQKPRFFFFPDLPSLPYLDPHTQPWAPKLLAAYQAIRSEAVNLLSETKGFEDFVRLRKGDRIENYLGGARPSWEAYFFFRHGVRFDSHHAECPATSRALSSIDLCEIDDHAPEICFSLLAPGTSIKPHYGVTNVRSVMHLPLLVPDDCALNVLGAGAHVWREGELMMFDDTFQHEAWNRSERPRMVLLMDCWNPSLTAIERLAVKTLIHTISRLHKAARAANAPPQ